MDGESIVCSTRDLVLARFCALVGILSGPDTAAKRQTIDELTDWSTGFDVTWDPFSAWTETARGGKSRSCLTDVPALQAALLLSYARYSVTGNDCACFVVDRQTNSLTIATGNPTEPVRQEP